MLTLNMGLVYTVINLLVLYILMKKFLFKPVNNILEQRRAAIEEEMNQAQTLKEEAMQLKESYEADTKGAKEASAGIIREARQKADQEASVILSQARKEADKIRTDTEERLKQEREKTMRGLQKDVADLAVEAAEQILSGGSRQREDEAFYDMFLRNAGEQKNAVQRGENA